MISICAPMFTTTRRRKPTHWNKLFSGSGWHIRMCGRWNNGFEGVHNVTREFTPAQLKLVKPFEISYTAVANRLAAHPKGKTRRPFPYRRIPIRRS
jgi:hypothetical protein